MHRPQTIKLKTEDYQEGHHQEKIHHINLMINVHETSSRTTAKLSRRDVLASL